MGFEEFLAARLPALLRYATAVVGDVQRAEDVVQEVLVRAERRWWRIRRMDEPEGYVKRMIVNEHLAWRRRRSSEEIPVEEGAFARIAADDHAEEHADRAEVWARIVALPPRQRAVLALRFYDGMSTEEIAEALGCSAATVRSHLSRALAGLRLTFAEEEAR